MLIAGLVVTFFWLIGFAVAIWINLNEAMILTLNEWGDFLAGSFAPLAFLWLVIGYFQQGRELRLSREALIMQAAELKNSVVQQEQLVLVTREEIEVAKGEYLRKVTAEKKLAQPLFLLKSSFSSAKDENNKIIGIDIGNFGRAILDVRISLIALRNEIRIDIDSCYDRFEKWDHESVKYVQLLVASSCVGNVDFVGLQVDYIDDLGDEESQVLSFKLNEVLNVLSMKASGF